MAIIEVQHLQKEFEYYKKAQGLQGSLKNFFHREKLFKKAVNDLSFAIEEGEIVGFLGPNGAGKTTTLKMLSGILFPSAGEARVLGYVPWERKNAYKKEISIVMGQKNQLWWDLPASESMFLNKEIYEVSDKDYKIRISEMAEILDVSDLLDVQVRRLSLGERMKMELIAALLHHPKVLFLDEPTIGLDVISQRRIREFLKYYNQQKKTTIILTSHYMEDIKDLCKRSIVITKGELVFDDATEKISGLMGSKKIIKIQGSTEEECSQCSKYGKVRNVENLCVTLEIEKERVNYVVSQLLEKGMLADFTIEEVPIEEGVSLLYQTQG